MKTTKIKVKDGRGLARKDVGEDNFKIVRTFFRENPNSTRKECSESTGLSLPTIRKHVNRLIGI